MHILLLKKTITVKHTNLALLISSYRKNDKIFSNISGGNDNKDSSEDETSTVAIFNGPSNSCSPVENITIYSYLKLFEGCFIFYAHTFRFIHILAYNISRFVFLVKKKTFCHLVCINYTEMTTVASFSRISL